MTDVKQPQGEESKARALMARPPLAVVATSSAPEPTAAPPTQPSREARVRELAYALFEARGCLPGHDVEDWLAAEAAQAAEAASAAEP